jgi:hypothetical protein
MTNSVRFPSVALSRPPTASPVLAAEERRALSCHIEEGYLQAERGELIDGTQARRELQAMKDNWHQERLPKR